MKTPKRVYVLVWMFAVLATFVPVLLWASPATAQNVEKLPVWNNPGQHSPFIGDAEQGCGNISAKSGMAESVCVTTAKKVKAVISGADIEGVDLTKCRVYHFKQGEKVLTTQTDPKTGESKAVYRTVHFTYPGTEKLVPSSHPLLRAITCPTGLDDGSAIALPDACDNWTLHWPVLEKPVLAEEYERWPECLKVWETTVYEPGYYVHVPEFNPCGCGTIMPAVNMYVPGGKSTTAEWACEQEIKR